MIQIRLPVFIGPLRGIGKPGWSVPIMVVASRDAGSFKSLWEKEMLNRKSFSQGRCQF
jgi:hypothetical protein